MGELKNIISWPIEYVKSVEVGGIVLDQISHLCTPPLQTCKLRRLVFPQKYIVFKFFSFLISLNIDQNQPKSFICFIYSGHLCFKHYLHQNICYDKMRQLKKNYRGIVWALRVGTHIVIKEKLPERIWQFQKLLWNHERRGFTDTK